MPLLILLSYLVGTVVTYFIIKLAVKHAITESLEDVTILVKDAILAALSEHDYKKENK